MALTPIDLGDVAQGTGGFVIHGVADYDYSGRSVASAGDINGDGFDDLIIGAAQAGGSNAGRSYVVFGKASGFGDSINLIDLDGTNGFAILGQDGDDYAGVSVSSAGDVNGDGFDDLIVGAPSADGGDNLAPNAGDSYVIFGKNTGFGASVDLTDIAAGSGGFVVHGEVSGDQSGASVASAGDINGDGFDDLLIGASVAAGGGGATEAGSTYVVFGAAGGFGAGIELADVVAGAGDVGFVIRGEDPYDSSGFSVASAGDINGDGFDDLVVGAKGGDGAGNAGDNSGDSYVVLGKAGGFGASIDLADVAAGTGGFVIHGRDNLDVAGYSVASAGDINGDGYNDLIIGAYHANGAGKTPEAGDSYVVFGAAGGFGASIDLNDVAAGTGGFVIYGQNDFDKSGLSVASAGDVNGDGVDDLIIGAPGANSEAGASYVLFGSTSGFGAAVNLADIAGGTGGFVINGEDTPDRSGFSVASAGDINGDGFSDLIIGAYYAGGAKNATTYAGDTYVLFGRDFTGTVTHPGTATAETLTGTAGADVIVAGRGADTLVGNGGADSLLGGAGNDQIRISDFSFQRIDGGAGTDTLALDGKGLALNLAAIANSKIQNIERIDLTGTGNNSVTVSALEVLNLSSTSNALRIIGNVGDSVTLTGTGWVQGATSGKFVSWSNGQAALEIHTDVAVPCYATGTLISTPFGPCPVEALRPGSAVLTADGTVHLLTWTGMWEADPADLAHRAVRIRANAFGVGQPARDLVVSPSHAIWLDGVLVPAINLLDGLRVLREPACVRHYHHIALPHHALVLAEGLAAETFIPLGDGRYADMPTVRNPLPRLEEGMELCALRARWGLADQPPGGPTLQGFFERVLPVEGGIVVEGWASDGPAAALMDIVAGSQIFEIAANRWRIDLDRAGLPAAGFRVQLPVLLGTPVRVLRRSDGTSLPQLS